MNIDNVSGIEEAFMIPLTIYSRITLQNFDEIYT